MILMDEGQIVEEATPEKFFASSHERIRSFLGKVLHM